MNVNHPIDDRENPINRIQNSLNKLQSALNYNNIVSRNKNKVVNDDNKKLRQKKIISKEKNDTYFTQANIRDPQKIGYSMPNNSIIVENNPYKNYYNLNNNLYEDYLPNKKTNYIKVNYYNQNNRNTQKWKCPNCYKMIKYVFNK